ncbi:hypothetical protein [Stutzerimonas stutzeri]|uniref:hypothetical protein n=1 Tax=Stutzerimonas stutzeri TaxID=316 RepID=UPI00265D3F17|nr:hypothetical protein [Stutzerimonas stutzeri]MCF6783727.1 hypothetical protein [Stutzerimonas stutzeri]
MAAIISRRELLAKEEAAPASNMATLIENLNARLVHAHSQGASCIALTPEDGFVLFHADRTKKPLPESLLGVLRALDEEGYVFVKDSTLNSSPSLRVYFRGAPRNYQVSLAELETWAA